MLEGLSRHDTPRKPIGSPRETPAPRSHGQANAIGKALTILRLLLDSDRALGTVEISRLTGFHKATTSRVLSMLAADGLAAQNDLTRKFAPGPEAYRLSIGLCGRNIRAIVDGAGPALDALHVRSGARLRLELWTGTGAVTCHAAPLSGARETSRSTHSAPPLHAAAANKAILSHFDPARLQRLLPPRLPAYTSSTITCRERLIAELGEARARGHALELEERWRGYSAVAIPLLDENGHPLAALSADLDTQDGGTDAGRLVETMRRTSEMLATQIAQLASPALIAWHYGHV